MLIKNIWPRPRFTHAGSFFVFVVLCTLSVAYAHRNAFYSVDNSFITYRYALNALQGNGLVFNVGEHYYGMAASGYAALLALLAKPLFALFPQLTIQNISVGISALSMLVIGACMWAMIPTGRTRWFDVLLLWFTFVVAAFVAVPFNEAAGHATYIFLALALSATVLAARERMLSAGAVLGLATVFRPDAMLMGPIIVFVSIMMLGIDWRVAFRDRRLFRFSGAFLAVFLPWLIYLRLHLAKAFTAVMDAKRVQVAMGYWPLYKPAVLLEYVTTALTPPLLLALVAGSVALACYWAFSRKQTDASMRQPIAPLYVGACWFLFLVLSTAFYFVINVTFWRWYGIPVVLSLFVIGYAGALCWLAADVSCLPGKASARTLFVALLGAVGISLMAGPLDYWAKYPQVNKHTDAYREVADKLKELEPDGTTIAMAEPGAFSVQLGPKFKVIDELGRTSPGVAHAYLKGDSDFLYREYKPKYIVCSWKGKYSGCEKPEVMASYSLVGEFDRDFWQQHLGHGAQLYRLTPAADKAVERRSDGVLDMVRDVRLGDTWGRLLKGPQQDELFLHPGATTDTSFVISCDSPCAELRLEARIAELPPEAPKESGSVRLQALASGGSTVVSQALVERATPATLKLGRGEFRIVVNNNGDAAYDWLLLRVSKRDSKSR
jgi:hypothetical protein